MRYEDIVTLTKHGNSRCVIIPAKWLKENKSKDFGYRVQIVLEYPRIQIYPLTSKWEQKHPSTVGRQDLIELKDSMPEETELIRSMTPPEELPNLTKV